MVALENSTVWCKSLLRRRCDPLDIALVMAAVGSSSRSNMNSLQFPLRLELLLLRSRAW